LKANTIIINYHSIADRANVNGHVDPIYSIDAERFEAHLKVIQESGREVVTLEQLENGLTPNKEYICLTFDDGHTSDMITVFPLLEKYEMKASFFVSLLNCNENDKRWEAYKEFAAQGHCIGAHSIAHNYLTSLSPIKQRTDLKICKSIIENKIGQKVNFYALPGGKFSLATVEIAKEEGYSGLLTTQFGMTNSDALPYLLNRYNVKRKTSLAEFKAIIKGDEQTLRNFTRSAKVKASISKVMGDKLTDRVNYLIHS